MGSFKNESAFWIIYITNYLLSLRMSQICADYWGYQPGPQAILFNSFSLISSLSDLFLFEIMKIDMWQQGDRDDTIDHKRETKKQWSEVWTLCSDCIGSNLASLIYEQGNLDLDLSVPQFHICKIGIIMLVNS